MSAPILLDCTIRDGSYAIDFKFTADDTALIAGLLDDAGVRYVEIGHGLGLGASEAGKGRAASHDLEVIERTRERVKGAKIGAFFIPDIGTEQHLRDAAAAGLDFVRVGQNADEIETALPTLELVRELGMEPFLNFMKTYGISPEEFARVSKLAADAGAVGSYVVDSAGGMLPDEVRAYVEATRAVTDVTLGFHGHSNLHLAVANSVAAWEAGATFVDTSVYGIGRSSGNVPTEVMAAVFDRMGVDCGVDALAIVDIAESYLRPLAEHLHPHTMTAVALGYGRFHSSFLKKAADAAREAGVNPFRLIVELGRRDQMRLSDELLETTLADLADAPSPELRLDVARFSDSRFDARRIRNKPAAVADLLDGLEVVAAKRNLAVVLDLSLTSALDEEEVTAEFVLEDDFMALGRVRAGSVASLAEALQPHRGRIGLLLLDLDGVELDDARKAIAAVGDLSKEGLVPYRQSALLAEQLADVALRFAPGKALVSDPGWLDPRDVDALAARLGVALEVRRYGAEVPDDDSDVCVIAGPLGAARFATDPPTNVVALDSPQGGVTAPGAILVHPNDAYVGRLPRWRAVTGGSREPALLE